MTELTTYDQVGDVALVTLDDGKANAFGPPMIAAVNAMLDRGADDARAVVLTGRPGVFSAASSRSIPLSVGTPSRLPTSPRSRGSGAKIAANENPKTSI